MTKEKIDGELKESLLNESCDKVVYPSRIKYSKHGDMLYSKKLYNVPNTSSAIEVIINLKDITFLLINKSNGQVILHGGHKVKSLQNIRRRAKESLVELGVLFEKEKRNQHKR